MPEQTRYECGTLFEMCENLRKHQEIFRNLESRKPILEGFIVEELRKIWPNTLLECRADAAGDCMTGTNFGVGGEVDSEPNNRPPEGVPCNRQTVAGYGMPDYGEPRAAGASREIRSLAELTREYPRGGAAKIRKARVWLIHVPPGKLAKYKILKLLRK
jgi:hypothetical protein